MEEEGEQAEASRLSLLESDMGEPSGKLGLRATARLSFQFCLLWVSWQCQMNCFRRMS